MTIEWFITPYDPKHWEDPEDEREKPTSDLYVGPTQLHKFLSERWSIHVFIKGSQKYFPPYVVQAQSGSVLRINLYNNNQIISLTNNPTEYFFEFILLYREFVSDKYQLFFFNSSSWDSLELKIATTAAEIKAFMGYTD